MKNKIVQIVFVMAVMLVCASTAFATAVTTSRVNDADDLLNGAVFDNGGADVLSITDSVGNNNDFTTGTITTAGNGGANAGTVTFLGSSIINTAASADVLGAAGAGLLAVNAGVAGETVTINGNTTATTFTVTSTGTVNADAITGAVVFAGNGILSIDTAENITGAVTNSSGAAAGTLTLEGTNSVTGQIGAAGTAALLAVNAGAAGTTSLGGDTFATTFTVSSTGTVNADSITATTINYAGDGTISVDPSENITAAITTATTGTGTLTLEGDNTVTGQVGTSALKLKRINAGASGASDSFTSSVFAVDFFVTSDGDVTLAADSTITTITFADDGAIGGTLTLNNGADLTGIITNASDDDGNLSIIGGNSTSGGAIGSAGANDLHDVQVGQLGTLTLGHNMAATTVTIYRAGTLVTSGNRTITGAVALNDTNFGVAGSAGVLTVGTTALSIAGSLSLASGTTLNLTANSATSFGTVVVTGGNAAFNAASTLNVTVGGYIPNGTTMAVVTSVAGVTSPIITDSSAMLSFTAATAAGDTTLTATRIAPSTTGNSGSVSTVLNQLGTISGDMITVMGALDSLSTLSQAASAIDQMDPTANGGGAATSFTANTLHLDAVTGRLADVRDGVYSGGQSGISTGDAWHEAGVWMKGFGSHADQDTRGGISGYQADTWGVAGGMDGLIAEGTRLGFAGGYSPSTVTNDGETGGTDISTYQGSVYAGFGAKPWYLNTAFSFGWHSYNSNRSISFGTINRTADADYSGQQYSVLLDGGYVIPAKGWEVTPLMSLEYSKLNLSGYTESGAGALNLTVEDQSYDFLQSGLGIKLAYPIINDSGSWIPEVHARWLYDFIGDAFQTTSTFTGGGSSFATNGLDPAQHALNAGAGIIFYSKGNITLSGTYDLILKEDYLSHNGEAVLRYNY